MSLTTISPEVSNRDLQGRAREASPESWAAVASRGERRGDNSGARGAAQIAEGRA